MNYPEAFNQVSAGRAMYSNEVGATLVMMPKCKSIMVVPRITHTGPIHRNLDNWPQIVAATDWELSGVKLPGLAQ